jgi:hypothetical protein
MILLQFQICLAFIVLSQLLKRSTASMVDPLNIQLCHQLEELFTYTVSPQTQWRSNELDRMSDHISRTDLLNYMAGSKKDCEEGIELAWSAANKNQYTRKMLRVLMAHPNFRISFYSSELYGVNLDGYTMANTNYGLDLLTIFVDPQKPDFSKSFVHECTHLLLNYIISDSLYDIFPMTVPAEDVNPIFSEANSKIPFNALKNKWTQNFERVLELYAKKLNEQSIPPQDALIIEQIVDSMDKESSKLQVLFIETTEKAKRYPINMKIPGHAVAVHPSTKKFAHLTVIKKVEMPKTDLVEVYLQGNNNFETYVINWLRYVQNHSKKYSANQQDSEFITHAIEEASISLLNNIYPELINALMNHCDRLLAEHPYEKRNKHLDNPKHYLPSYYYKQSWVCESDAALVAVKRKILGLIKNGPLSIDMNEVDIAITTLQVQLIENSLKTSKNQPSLDVADNNLLLGEMYFLKNDYKNAFRCYHRADKGFSKNTRSSKTIFDQIPGSLGRYKTVKDENGHLKTIRSSLQRKN